MVICACSHQQRAYPALAIEMQKELGAGGAAFDMNLGCSSAAAALHVAFNLVRSGGQRRVLIVTPEIITGALNFRDRQTHFIFGDAATAMVVEALEDGETRPGRFELVDTRSWTQFSNNIRNNFGFLVRAGQAQTSVVEMEGNMIKQVGNKVFKDVTVAGHRFIVDFLRDHELTPEGVRRFWLHQANARMNAMILKLSFGHEVDHDRAPMVLDRLGNTAAAGAIIALSENHAVDPHSASLRSAPLPRSTGERKRLPLMARALPLPHEVGQREVARRRRDGVGGCLIAEEGTPTPSPSPQGGGGAAARRVSLPLVGRGQGWGCEAGHDVRHRPFSGRVASGTASTEAK
jgi:3-oxoacyl-[acyl-carrier-protein] synthase III